MTNNHKIINFDNRYTDSKLTRVTNIMSLNTITSIYLQQVKQAVYIPQKNISEMLRNYKSNIFG